MLSQEQKPEHSIEIYLILVLGSAQVWLWGGKASDSAAVMMKSRVALTDWIQ